ncbi:SOS response-associated peptidase family protein [Sphingomonas sp. AR_OL41]|uniref:SOS response-associated peptidase family protein n=1 Tax=Sphingomonas sp. AR_OL41 TaxID=3042729 RepID=UPI002480FF9F|nr:SOS response-associated peptidase family protein [Sphingomonas sp. AR_OL41]MDH7974803.1 SOS response-associated peptidase family protein [Sphingomonas sp. AR_OL41]
MCNRFHQGEKVVRYLREHGIFVDEDLTLPSPKVFPTGKKTARHGLVVHRSTEGNRPLVVAAMEWGFPTTVPGKREGVKLTKYVTNARNLKSSFWRASLTDPARRCLVPFTHFAEPHPEGGKGDDGQPKQAWFSITDHDVGMFAGLWRPTERGPAFAFATCEPNAFVAPIHGKAMPAIVRPAAWTDWLDGEASAAEALICPYAGEMRMQVETPPVLAGQGG